jgi:hypothetical protein
MLRMGVIDAEDLRAEARLRWVEALARDLYSMGNTTTALVCVITRNSNVDVLRWLRCAKRDVRLRDPRPFDEAIEKRCT